MSQQPFSSDGGFSTVGNVTSGNLITTGSGGDIAMSSGNITGAGNISLNGGYINGGTATVVTDGINSIAQAAGATMDVYGFPFAAGLARGQLTITDVTTPSEANGTWYYQSFNNSYTYQIYTDSTYSTLVDASGWSSYTGGGSVAITLQDPPANIVINTNGFLTTFANTGNLSVPGNIVGSGGSKSIDNIKIGFNTPASGSFTDIGVSGSIQGSESAYITMPGYASITGNITTAGNFVGNGAALTNVTVSVAGNIVGTQPNVSLVAGSFTATFDNTGLLTLPTMGGDEGGELNLGIPVTNTTLQNRVAIDVFQDRVRFFEGSANAKGVYIDLAQSSAGVGTLLNNRVSGLVNAGTFVTMDLIKATVTTSGNRGLSLATTTGTLTYNIGGTYATAIPSSSGSAGTGTLTTTPTASIFNWGFTNQGDTATYILTDTTNSRAYRITLQIGNAFNNNMITIERLI